MEQEVTWRSANTDEGAVIGWWAMIQGCWTIVGDDGVWVVMGGGLCLTGRASAELEGAVRIEAARAEAIKRVYLLVRDVALVAPPAVRRAPQGAPRIEEPAAPEPPANSPEDLGFESEGQVLKRRQLATLEWFERLCDEGELAEHDRAQLRAAICTANGVTQLSDVAPLALIRVCEWLDGLPEETRAPRVRLHVAAKALPAHLKRHLVTCSWCGASVLKTTTAATGATMFVDPYPDPDNRGTVTLEEDGKDRLISTVWGSAKLAAHYSHHYTCPNKRKGGKNG